MVVGKLIIIPALGHQNKGKLSFTGSGLFVLMSQCGNNNELAHHYVPCDRLLQKAYHKKLNVSHDFSTVVTLTPKLHDISTVRFPWQHNGLQALSFQRGKSEFSSLKKCYLLLLFVQWV